MDLTRPTSLTETTRKLRRTTHPGKNSTGWRLRPGPSLARERSETRSMSGDGRCARAEQRDYDAVRSNSAAASSRNRPKTVDTGNDGMRPTAYALHAFSAM